MRYFLENKPPRVLWLIALAGAVFAVGATKVVDFDIWWHLKTGEVIWEWKQIPRADIFSYTAAGSYWMNGEWLYQVFIWLLFSHLGFASLTMLKAAVAAGTVVDFMRTMKLMVSSTSAVAWAAIIMLVGISDHFADRPYIFSLLFISIFCLALHSFAAGKRKTLWALPILQVLWINLHGGGAFGPQLVLAFALGESIQFYFGGTTLERKQIWHLWLIGMACAAALMLNPFGVEVILFPLSVFHKMPTILTYTQEWILPFDPRLDPVISQIVFRTILAATLISFIVNRKKARFSHLMLLTISCLLVIKGRRFTPEFLVVNLPILFFNLKGPAGRLFRAPAKGYMPQWINLAIITLFAVSALSFGIPGYIYGETVGGLLGTGTTPHFAPKEMVDFLEQNDIHGRVFNDMGLGGYLIYRRWPGEKVFIDGRTPIYGDDFYRKFVEAYQLTRNFEELDRRYRFDYLVFKSGQACNIREMHEYLWKRPTWKLVYASPAEGLVYLRNEPKFAKLIRRYALKKHPFLEYMESIKKGAANEGEGNPEK